MIVVDASATLAWAFEEGIAARITELVASDTLLAPPIWRLEVVNVILRHERRGLVTSSQSEKVLRALEGLRIEIVDSQVARSLDQMAAFARPHQLTSYDAAYLDIAISAASPLITLDQNLKDAAGRLGVTLLDV
jgi:predicted nucleic acid-binding protein